MKQMQKCGKLLTLTRGTWEMKTVWSITCHLVQKLFSDRVIIYIFTMKGII